MRNPSQASVVVGVNGTSAALAAVRVAAREAVSRAGRLRVIHAFTWPDPLPASAGKGYDEARRAASRILDEAVATAQRSTPGVRVTGQLVDGAADQVLVRFSRAADLVVLGDDDVATTRWLPPGSVLVQTTGRAWCPVLVSRGPRPLGGPVLAAVDGSAASLTALRTAAAEGRRRHAPVELVHVTAGAGPDAEAAGRQVLAAAVTAVPELAGAPARLLSGPPGPTLARWSAHAGLMVLGPRGARGAGLLGTVARDVLHHGVCPAVFVHGPCVPTQRIGSAVVRAGRTRTG